VKVHVSAHVASQAALCERHRDSALAAVVGAFHEPVADCITNYGLDRDL